MVAHCPQSRLGSCYFRAAHRSLSEASFPAGHLASQLDRLSARLPDRLLLFRWAHWSAPAELAGRPRALLSDGALRGSSVQRGVALIKQSCGLVHHRQLRLLHQVLRADGAPIQGKLRAVLHP